MQTKTGKQRNPSMKKYYLLLTSLALLIYGVAASTNVHSAASTNPSISFSNRNTRGFPAPVQYEDPYSEFRNARYSNAGLLNERDEIRLGMQLHREVTKKYNLTDTGLDRVDRIGQRV